MCHYFCDTLLLLTQLHCVVALFGDHSDTVITDCGSNCVTAAVNPSLPKVNLTKPRKLLNPELSNKT